MNKKKESILYIIVRPIITFLFKIFFTPKIIGSKNIPTEGRIILAGNHTSNFDCLLLISCTKRPIHFLAKKELWNGFKKIIFNNLGLIPVDRKNKNHNALVSAEEYLDNEMLIGIFPEGTTEKEGKMLPFKIGAVKMANDKNSKIVPFVIKGKYKLFSKNLTIEFLKPIKITSNLEIEIKKLEDIIHSKIEGDNNVNI